MIINAASVEVPTDRKWSGRGWAEKNITKRRVKNKTRESLSSSIEY